MKTADPRVWQLARDFLASAAELDSEKQYDAAADRLAVELQSVIEDFIHYDIIELRRTLPR